ncbi:MAG: SRPBCC domain-containing protein [Solirubrobacteraceae bacterium]|nr:SRPBCC domain-containing protein [Solirubrobacteraceae bacterium]
MSCIKEVLLPVERDEAWAAVTDPGALEAWLAEEVELDLREGGEATFVLETGEERRAIVEEVEPGERWTFWWWTGDAPGSRVTVELAPAAGGTTVRVTESPVGPWASAAPAARGAGAARRALAPA